MGRRGPLPRAKDAEGRPLEGTVITQGMVDPQVVVEVPSPPPGLLASSRRVWQEFWGSRAATWVDRGSAYGRLVRWIHDVDQYQRILNDMRPGVRPGLAPVVEPPLPTSMAHPVGEEPKQSNVLARDPEGVPGVFDPQRPWLGLGSTGQVAEHPHAKLLGELDQRIHRAEVEFGMTPYAAVRLGLAGVQGALTAQQLSDLLAKRGEAQPAERDAPWAAGLAPAKG